MHGDRDRRNVSERGGHLECRERKSRDHYVETGSALQIGEFTGHVRQCRLPCPSARAPAAAASVSSPQRHVTLNGGGTVTLGDTTWETSLDVLSTSGDEPDQRRQYDTSVAADRPRRLRNQSAGEVVGPGPPSISAGTFTNEGPIGAEASATLNFGQRRRHGNAREFKRRLASSTAAPIWRSVATLPSPARGHRIQGRRRRNNQRRERADDVHK